MIDLAEKLSLILFHLKTDISVVVEFYFQSKTFIRSIDPTVFCRSCAVIWSKRKLFD